MTLGQRAALWLFDEIWGPGHMPPMADLLLYGKTLLVCANADGDLASREREWVLGYLACLGLPADEVALLQTYPADDELSVLLEGARVVEQCRDSVVYDAIRAAAADGELHVAEMERICELAAVLGVPPARVERLVGAYAAEDSAKRARIGLLFPNNAPFT